MRDRRDNRAVTASHATASHATASHAPASPVAAVEFSTAPLPPRQRFEAYRAWVGGWMDTLPPASADGPPGDYRMRQSAWRFGPLALIASAFLDPSVNERAAGRARRDMLDHWGVHVLTSGRVWACVGGVEAVVRSGPARLFGLHQALRQERGAARAIVLYVPRDAAPPDLAAALDARLGGELGGAMGDLLRGHLEALPGALAGGMTQRQGAAAAAATLALLRAAAMGPDAARRDRADEAALAGAAAARVTALIREHLSDPALRPDGLARLSGIPRGRLYALMERGGGVARAIQRERLRAAARALGDPADQRPIAGIAAAVGLPDPAAFSRAFRREFGAAAREWRERAAVGLDHPEPRAPGGAPPGDVFAMLRRLGRA